MLAHDQRSTTACRADCAARRARLEKCEHLIQLAGEIGRIASLEGC